jgi:hypothetical protein
MTYSTYFYFFALHFLALVGALYLIGCAVESFRKWRYVRRMLGGL